ncbi:MAG: hypothetical protein Q8P61_00540, partial [Candidatus Nanopelagicales bacterium]|nr:hypothetical protein [Candidatus Nanopelagicales bacterium]
MTKPPLDPTDEDAFDTAKQWLLHGFQEHAGPDATWVADQVLDYKWHYFDPDLSSWTPGEVMAILLDRFPAKSSVDHADRPEVVAAFAAFLRWLGSAGVLRSGNPEELAGFVEALAGPFMEAMADESKWGMAKRLFAQVAADGVDITDEASVQAWMQRFNSGSRAERDAILGPMPSGPAPDQRLSLPPVTLAPPERLTPAAEQSVWLRRVRDFVGFVGEGRPLTATGQLKLADGKALVDLLGTSDRVDQKIGDRVFRTQSSAELTQVDFTFRLARAAGYVKVIKKKVQPTRKASKLSDTLESWFALFETMTKIGLATHRWSQSHHNFGWWTEDLDQALPGMLTQLYAEGEPIWVNDLGTAFGDSLEQKYVFAEERFAELARDYATCGLRAS